MSTVYTVELYSLPSAALGVNTSSAVPVGKRWVITDIYARSPGGLYTSTPVGMSVFADDSAAIFSAQRSEVSGARGYHWTGRQALDAGDHITVFAGAAGWSFRITGFSLTLP